MSTKQDITTTGMPLIDSVVERLCHENSLSTVWHRSGQGAPMPSLPVLTEILERLRDEVRSTRIFMSKKAHSVWH